MRPVNCLIRGDSVPLAALCLLERQESVGCGPTAQFHSLGRQAAPNRDVTLDDINRQLVLALIERICAADGTTVLYVNHREQDRIEGIDHHLALG